MKKFNITYVDGIMILEWLLPPDLDDLRIVMKELTGNGHPSGPLLIFDPGTAFNPSAGVLEASVEILKEYIPPLENRIAMVVRKELHFGLGRMLEALCGAESICFQVFRDFEKARRWLVKVPGMTIKDVDISGHADLRAINPILMNS